MTELKRFELKKDYWVARFYDMEGSGMVCVYQRCHGKKEDWIAKDPFMKVESCYADVLNNIYLDLKRNDYSWQEIRDFYG